MDQETHQQLLDTIQVLNDQLNEARETLAAIQSGFVDALVINAADGPQVYTLMGAQHPYRIFVEKMNEGAITIDPDGVILYCNTHFAEMVECPLEKAIGSSFLQFVAPGFRNVIVSLLDGSQASLKSEITLGGCSGRQLPVLMSTGPLPAGQGLDGHCVVITDLSQQKQTEEALRLYADQNARLSRELSQYTEVLEERVSQRTSELEEINRELEAFTYTVSHDLRAPLRSIDGFARLLADNFGDQFNEKSRFYLDKILENSADMSELITALLTLSRHNRQPLEKRLVHPAKLVEQVLSDLQITPEVERLEIHVQDMPRCLADPVLLKQVYINLVSNAVKFSARRQPAVIEIGCRPPDRSENGDGEAASPVYYVKDNGVGLNVEKARNLFGVFQRYHKQQDYDGIGVGLAIVQRIIHRHGGQVWAESQEDQGAAFCFTLK